MKKIYPMFILLLIIGLILIIGPLDIFVHGYFSSTVPYHEINTSDFLEYINLEERDFEMKFSPVKEHFAGFEINVINQPEGNQGELHLDIYQEDGRQVDQITVDLSKVTAGEWYKTYANTELEKGKTYILRISAENCQTYPYLQIVDPSYLTDENIEGNLLIGYAYKESTFTLQNKILICMFFAAIGGLTISWKRCSASRNILSKASVFLILISMLSWNYMYNSMDNRNENFEEFQSDSEDLVVGVINAEHYNVPLETHYGLGRYTNIFGLSFDYQEALKTNEDWQNGYSLDRAGVCIDNNGYTRSVAVAGNWIAFADGSSFMITEVSQEGDGESLAVYVDSEEILKESKYGDIGDITFLASDGSELPRGQFEPYISQFGLQGKVFRHFARYMDYENVVDNLHLICCIAAAIVFVAISYLIYEKYNKLMAVIFLITFWLAPWTVNFARNLYWVEFTWFLPMAIGLLCAWKVDVRKYRIMCIVGAFISILIKCLCGYEYISTIMMGLISFLLVDFVTALYRREQKRRKLLLRTIFLMGCAALAGFIVAIGIHALLRGEGNVVEGIVRIFKEDVLRRTSGADLNNFDEVYWSSFNASLWQVVCQYFHFPGEIITGIDGNLFPLLCIIPVAIILYDFMKGRFDWEKTTLYVIFFAVTISWFVLGKSHSSGHIHINYVLWYFGFIQICFYIIIDRIYQIFRNRKCE